MLFNSSTYAVFFAVVLFLHYLPLPWKIKKFQLLIASFIFYGAWNPPFLLLLWLSTVMDWLLAKVIFQAKTPARRKALFLISLVVNFGLLGFFKYGQFVLENVGVLSTWFGIHFTQPEWKIILPVGISFYTFQTLSYTLDVYFGRTVPAKSFLDYCLYIAFFPQLVAGPIVRSEDFLPQCVEPKQATSQQFNAGIKLIILGLFQKMVIADFLMAPVVEKVFHASGILSFVDAWTGVIAFSWQIFCDFAGYSTCAIGSAMCLGFHLPDNFRQPYAAAGFSDFWKRWHISLSTWLRDYLYIPMGGNRKGKIRTIVNLMSTMLLGGLWHGASWTFVIWGGFHGLLLCLQKWMQPLFKNVALLKTRFGLICFSLLTYLVVCFTWVFFRARSFEQALAFLKSMTQIKYAKPHYLLQSEVLAVLISAVFLLGLQHWKVKLPRLLEPIMLLGMVVLIWLFSGEDRAFIYFQF